MKLKFLVIPTALVILSCGGANEKKNDTSVELNEKSDSPKMESTTKSAMGLFNIKAAKVEFKETGGPTEGTETLYFDDFGNTAVLISDKQSKYEKTNQTIIWKDGKSTMINHEKKTVMSSPFRPKVTEPPSIADLSESSRNTAGYEKLADETVAGKNCEVWYNKAINVKYWLWNKIEMKIENMGAYTREAVSAEEISSIPTEVMNIPGDYKQ